ncbi:MAG: hypothetical protein KGL53_13515, partial [Elusimicrobia bacterium]|nr:hypothetical protein [Elusimicrobiota bacterium]
PLRKGAVRADPRQLTVWVDDRLLTTLFHKEFAALRLLMESPGPVAKEELMRGLGYGEGQASALKQVLHRLRRSFGEPESGRIRTTPEGYELLG